ncbi:helicase C-terminal domain-containing protein [Fennellomyces sp. T-0311]|nr:helicase C-terminal domain-containing protein [Fennellomyces sp. T-0311]
MSSKSTSSTRRSRKNKTEEGQGTLPFQKPKLLRKPDKRADDAPMNRYPMSGITVEFPYKPYPAQIQMMSKIVKALKEKQNALLESPTGSGKSLAILCASLAWANHEKNLLVEEAEQVIANEAQVKERIMQEIIEIADDMDDENTLIENTTQNLPRKLIKADGDRSRSSSPAPEISIDQGNSPDPSQASMNPKTYIHAPKIYVGSRTHKQLSQLVSELRRNTRYRPQMSVLGSREQYCIHKRVRKEAEDKNEACTQLLDSNSCIYAKNVNKVLRSKYIRPGGELEVWDIEDLTQVAKLAVGCPYFASRSLAEHAEIIFCPYNYLLDPLVRSRMGIDLTDSVVVLDEAHNIEDIARSAGSYEATETDLIITSKEITQVLDHWRTRCIEHLGNAYKTLFLFVSKILEWMTSDPEPCTLQRDGYEEHHKVWNNRDLMDTLESFHIKKETLKGIEVAYDIVQDDIAKLRQENKDRREDVDPITFDDEVEEPTLSPTNGRSKKKDEKSTRNCISMKSLHLLEGFIMVFRFIIPEQGPSREKDYSLALIRRVHRKRKRDWETKFGFWCLNPGIVFRNMADSVRSVILTSGTLSPLDTFASELETPFPIRLEANHVIEKSQVWIRSIHQGPGSVQLYGTWERASQFQYQDDVGESLYQISETVPYGILCFVPSYNSMEKLLERWKATGLYKRLEKRKHIICEPSGAGSKDLFEQLMNKYYHYISEAENDQTGTDGINGAIMFAVYRGKVSEGIDFTNNNCRAVVALGIPFPNIKDILVDLKKEYNTKRYKSGDPVLDGNAWYRTQAYRAINQALGRCIRHRRDWGAVILLESRFCEIQNVRQLSKWLRPLCMVESNYQRAMEGLREFVAERNEFERLEREAESEQLKQEPSAELLEQESMEQEQLDLVQVKIEALSPSAMSATTDSP